MIKVDPVNDMRTQEQELAELGHAWLRVMRPDLWAQYQNKQADILVRQESFYCTRYPRKLVILIRVDKALRQVKFYGWAITSDWEKTGPQHWTLIAYASGEPPRP